MRGWPAPHPAPRVRWFSTVSGEWRWPLLLLVPALLALAVFYGLRARQALSAPEIETVTAAVSRDVQPSAGTPILTASGYVVARRQAVVSAKCRRRLIAVWNRPAVTPYDRGPQDLFVLINADKPVHLVRNPDRRNVGGINIHTGKHLCSGKFDIIPPPLRILLGPAGLLGNYLHLLLRRGSRSDNNARLGVHVAPDALVQLRVVETVCNPGAADDLLHAQRGIADGRGSGLGGLGRGPITRTAGKQCGQQQ